MNNNVAITHQGEEPVIARSKVVFPLLTVINCIFIEYPTSYKAHIWVFY
nr:MAG TPA: hypothetical protein [Bacteriophage sp.]